MRKLKFHEQKLLKKVDFLKWKNENNLRELQARRWGRRRARGGTARAAGAALGLASGAGPTAPPTPPTRPPPLRR